MRIIKRRFKSVNKKQQRFSLLLIIFASSMGLTHAAENIQNSDLNKADSRAERIKFNGTLYIEFASSIEAREKLLEISITGATYEGFYSIDPGVIGRSFPSRSTYNGAVSYTEIHFPSGAFKSKSPGNLEIYNNYDFSGEVSDRFEFIIDEGSIQSGNYTLDGSVEFKITDDTANMLDSTFIPDTPPAPDRAQTNSFNDQLLIHVYEKNGYFLGTLGGTINDHELAN